MSEFRCNECDRDFSGQQALEDHNRSKHYITPKKSLGKKVKNRYIWILLIIVIVVGYLYFVPSVEIEPGKYDDFAQCVADSGAKMYGAYWCVHCNQQKESLGDSFYKIDYVECSLPNNGGQTEECKDAGIESYPTWEFGDGIRMSGFVPLEKLAERTGCELPE